MTVYTSSVFSPIAGDGGGKYYSTFFFVNGPYNPNINNVANANAPSTRTTTSAASSTSPRKEALAMSSAEKK